MLLLAPAPLLLEYFQTLWQFEEYRFFPVLFLAVGLLVFERWDRVTNPPQGYLAWTLIATSLVLIAFATLIWSPWLGLLGWLCGLSACFYCQHERGSAHSLLPLSIPMWLALRLPLGLDIKLTSDLQQRTSRLSSYIFDRLAIPHKRSGNIFELVHGQLFVEDACSGVQSLFALLFVAALLVVWLRRPLILLPIYLLAGLIWSGVMNVVRVVCIGFAQERLGLNLSHGWPHEVLGYACLTGAILLLLSTDRLLRVVFFPIPVESAGKQRNPLINAWNRCFREFTAVPAVPEQQPDRSSAQNAGGIAVIAICVLLLPMQWLARPRHPVRP